MANRIVKYTTAAGADFEVEDDNGSGKVVAESISIKTNALFVDRSTGYVGVGTEYPTQPFQVLSTTFPQILVRDPAGANDQVSIKLVSSASGSDGKQCRLNMGGLENKLRLQVGSADAGLTSPFAIDVSAPDDAMVIDSNGNVGVGVTPESSWGSGYSAIQYAGLGAFWGFSTQQAGASVKWSSNVYYDGSNFKYIVEDEAIDIGLVDGQFTINTASSGTADTNISFGNLKFRVENDGTVNMGTHSAIGAETVTGYITIKDTSGVSRKLAVVS